MAGGGVLTVVECDKVLKVSTATVYGLIERGQLEHFRVSNAIRVRRDALDALLRSGEPRR